MASVVDENRFSAVTPDNHAGSIWIATLLCLVYSVITVTTRGYLRKKMYGIDDYLILVATLLHLGEAIAVILGLDNGLGQTISLLRASNASKASQTAFAAQLLYIASSCLAKISTVWLMMRLFNFHSARSHKHRNSKFHYTACMGIVAVIAAWGIGSIVGLAVDCSVSDFIRTPSLAQCPDQFLRWKVVTAIDIATEAMLVTMSLVIIAPVHLAPYLKFQIVLAFAFRLPLVALAVLRLHYVGEYTHSDNAGTAQEPILVIQQIYLCWSIISATIPNLKSFVRSFGSGFGIGIDMDRYTNAYGSKGSNRHQHELGSVKNTSHSAGSRNGTRQDNRSYKDMENQDQIVHARQGAQQRPLPQDSISIGSIGSREQFIRKDVQWRIHFENSRRI